jgi:hypothetical protein
MHLWQHNKSIDRVFLLLVKAFCVEKLRKIYNSTVFFFFQFCFYTVKKGYQVSHPIPSRLGTGKSITFFFTVYALDHLSEYEAVAVPLLLHPEPLVDDLVAHRQDHILGVRL